MKRDKKINLNFILSEFLWFLLADKLCYIYTSGTTGLPKACNVKHVRYCYLAQGINLMMGICSDDIVYCTLPLYHTNGGILSSGQMLLGGATLVVRKKFSASNFWLDCIKYKCTVSVFVLSCCQSDSFISLSLSLSLSLLPSPPLSLSPPATPPISPRLRSTLVRSVVTCWLSQTDQQTHSIVSACVLAMDSAHRSGLHSQRGLELEKLASFTDQQREMLDSSILSTKWELVGQSLSSSRSSTPLCLSRSDRAIRHV